MSNERAQLRAEIAIANRKIAEKNLLAEQYAMELREMLAPSIMDYYAELPMLSFGTTFDQLKIIWREMGDLKKQVAKMETALNG